MKGIRRKCNPMMNLSKIASNKIYIYIYNLNPTQNKMSKKKKEKKEEEDFVWFTTSTPCLSLLNKATHLFH